MDLRVEEKHFYQFKNFRLHVEERQLFNDENAVPLTPKAFDVLVMLVVRSGHLIEKDELMRTIWADSFVEEANITRIIHTLRKTLGEEVHGEKFIETVAKKGYRFVAEVSEICPPGAPFKANGNHNPSVSIEAPSTGEIRSPAPKIAGAAPKLNARFELFVIGFLSAVSLLLLLAFYLNPKNTGGSEKLKSVAVLPLKPINTANRDEILEMGIADSLIHRLVEAKNFTVRPLSATRKYMEIEQDPVAAGREQKVDFVLASNYQLVNGKIRVTSQFIDVSTGNIVDTFQSSDIEAADVFTMQDMIAGEVGNELLTNPHLSPEAPSFRWRLSHLFFFDSFKASSARIGTKNEEAYRLYLMGKNLTMRRNAGDHLKAIEYFEQALRLDPNFARAYAKMAHAHLWSDRNKNLGAKSEKVKELVKKALELDSKLAEAYVSRADLELVYEWDFPAAEKDLTTAIELEPTNDTARWLYALLLSYQGRFDEALREIDTAQAIDPGAVMYMRDRGRILYYARRYDEAIAELKRAADFDEGLIIGWLRIVYAAKGDEAMSYETFIKIQKRVNPDRVQIYQKAYEAAGWAGIGRKALEFIKPEEQKPENSNYETAMLYVSLGEKDKAFEYLNKALERREWRMIMLKVDPLPDALRDDPRFDDLLRRVGLP